MEGWLGTGRCVGGVPRWPLSVICLVKVAFLGAGSQFGQPALPGRSTGLFPACVPLAQQQGCQVVGRAKRSILNLLCASSNSEGYF